MGDYPKKMVSSGAGPETRFPIGAAGWTMLVLYFVMLVGVTALFSTPIVIAVSAPLSGWSAVLPWALAAIAAVVFEAFFYAYVLNAVTLQTSISPEEIKLTRLFESRHLTSTEISQIRLLRGGRGWRYIGLFVGQKAEVVTNIAYSERTFDAISSSLRDWASLHGIIVAPEEINAPGKPGETSFRCNHAALYLVAALSINGAVTLIAEILHTHHFNVM